MKNKHPYSVIWDKYSQLYEDKVGMKPEISFGVTGRLIKRLLTNHSKKGIIKIIELFFENEHDMTPDLKIILSAFFINKYAPQLRLDPNVYSNAEEWNKEVY